MKRIRIKKINKYESRLSDFQLESLRFEHEKSRMIMLSIYPFINENPIGIIDFYDEYYYLYFIKNHKIRIRREYIDISIK